MFPKSQPPKIFPPKDHRHNRREPLLGVTAMVKTASGVLLEGVVQDVSDGGIGISGDITGLKRGDKVEVALIIQGERVEYQAQVRHIDEKNRNYGVHFESGPRRQDAGANDGE